MINTDKQYHSIRNKLPDPTSWYMFREYYLFGYFPTFKNKANEILYYTRLNNRTLDFIAPADKEFMTPAELYQFLYDYWRPISLEETDFYCKMHEFFNVEKK